MMKYVALADSYGYLGRYWKIGDKVEAEELPNENFKQIAGEELCQKENVEPEKMDAEENKELQEHKQSKKRRG